MAALALRVRIVSSLDEAPTVLAVHATSGQSLAQALAPLLRAHRINWQKACVGFGNAGVLVEWNEPVDDVWCIVCPIE